ncbi:hypothetical protein QFZ24_003270 [Streptomyces phaeochromogenes]|uniref:hypothetical protein n=1 Tax=Streptomyces phaeochromogenes TaxID=1923 RepID=UPI00278D9FB9|nr:hypothetical protein [Streptomyces phaeochromogenes]MDQ0949347.1 hypothetical protein [Streptomyces phaeochromogenes]
MSDTVRWHASPRRNVPPTTDLGTGEIRVPLALFAIDEHRGDIDLVLSRTEGESLAASLRAALTEVVESDLHQEAIR